MDSAVLEGFCVGITADRRWEEQADLLRRRGATVMHGPTLRTLSLGADAGLRQATESVVERPPHLLVANTGIGMRTWFSAADGWDLRDPLLAALATTRIYARGPKASSAVHGAGLDVVARAGSERLSEAVEMALADDTFSAGARVALQLDGRAAPAEVGRLEKAGADVVTIPVYEWRLPEDPQPAVDLARAIVAGGVDAVTFTSAPAIRNLLAIADEHDVTGLLDALKGGRVVVGCVGPVCAEAAYEAGITDVVIPAASRLSPMIRAVADRLSQRR